MEFITFLLENAKEIALLCFGFGFLILVFFVVRTLVVATRVLGKIDDLSDIFIQYVQKPLAILLQAKRFLDQFLGK